MIPENQYPELAETTATGKEVEDKARNYQPEEDVANVTAWKRYQKFVQMVETRGGEYNRRSTIEAMFRGGDLFYINQR